MMAFEALSVFLTLMLLKCLYDKGRLKKCLDALQRAPVVQEREYRVERFDVLWYPVVSFSPASKTVSGARAGLPHCKSCVLPLGSGGSDGGWVCPRCKTAYPASLADLAVVDTVGREALRYFLERDKDYKVTAGASRA